MVKNKQIEERKIFAEIKEKGFDVKVIRQLLKLRRMKKRCDRARRAFNSLSSDSWRIKVVKQETTRC